MNKLLKCNAHLMLSTIVFTLFALPVFAAAPVSDGFDYPVGRPNGDGYNHVSGWDFLEWTGTVYHPGEDWNGNGGGDSDLGDPVYAISSGEIVVSGNYGTGWGNIILIEHNLPDGSTVWSNYAHLQNIIVSSGIVSKGQQIGTIGKGYNNEYYAHLHFEIRKQYRSPNDWVPSWSQSQVQDYYYDPSDFINSHRNLYTTMPISGDVNGDGIDIYGTFDPSTAGFTFNEKTVNFGTSTDLPTIGDWDHDGKDEIGVFRPDESGQSKFYLITRDWSSLSGSAGSADKTISFAYYPTNIPIAGDWDGDGDDDIGGFEPGNNNFYLYILNLASSSATSYPSHPSVHFGINGDKPIIGDWDGDGDDDVGVHRDFDPDYSNNIVFYFDLDLSGDQSDLNPIPLGNNGDIAVIGDWDGDGDDNIGGYRPSTDAFYTDSNQPIVPDTTNPTISISSPTNGQTVTTSSITVSGNANDNVALSKVEVKVGSGSWQLASGTTSWSKSVTLESGSNTIYARATDTSGNTIEASVTISYTPPDTTNPTISISSPTNGQTVSTGSITVSGNANDNIALSKVEVKMDSGSWQLATGTTSWSKSVTLASGSNTIYARATDTSGNIMDASVTITYTSSDTTNPTISISSPTNGQTVSTGSITVSGNANDNIALSKVEVKVGSGSWQLASGTTSWSKSVTLASGSNTIYARATDTSGNIMDASVTITYQAGIVGDINGDGSVTSVDALMVLQMSVGNLAKTSSADINGDGNVTSLDALMILQAVVGNIIL